MKLLYYPNKALATTCEKVEAFDTELHKFLDDMQLIMKQNNGMGLAANQVGILKRIFIMKDKKDKVWEFINPEIVFTDDVQYEDEGCLSFPGTTVQVKRAKQVSIKAQNRDGEDFHISAYEREAICIQHEMDHLEGITFLNYLSRQQKRDVLRKVKK